MKNITIVVTDSCVRVDRVRTRGANASGAAGLEFGVHIGAIDAPLRGVVCPYLDGPPI